MVSFSPDVKVWKKSVVRLDGLETEIQLVEPLPGPRYVRRRNLIRQSNHGRAISIVDFLARQGTVVSLSGWIVHLPASSAVVMLNCSSFVNSLCAVATAACLTAIREASVSLFARSEDNVATATRNSLHLMPPSGMFPG